MAVISCLWCGSAPKLHWNTGAGWSQVSSYGLSYPPVTCLPDTLALFRIMTEILTNSHSDEISCCCCPTHNWWHHSLEPSQEKHLFHRGVLLSHVNLTVEETQDKMTQDLIDPLLKLRLPESYFILPPGPEATHSQHGTLWWCQSPETFYKYCKEPSIPVWLCSKTKSYSSSLLKNKQLVTIVLAWLNKVPFKATLWCQTAGSASASIRCAEF